MLWTSPLVVALLLAAEDKPAPAGLTPIAIGKLERKDPVTYEKDIAPLFAAKCRVCHEGKNTEGGYDLSTYALAMKGGKRGAKIVVPGKAEESFLWMSSSHRVKPIMPPKSESNPLTPEEVAVLKRWIDDGAKGPATEVKTRAKVVLGLPPALVKPVRALVMTPDNKFLIAGRGNQVEVFDTKKGDFLRALIDPELKTPNGESAKAACLSLVETMAISPDGQTLAVGTFGEVVMWNLEKGTINRRLGGFADRVVALAYSPDGKRLAVGGGAPTEDGELRLYDAVTGSVILDIKPSHSDSIFGLSFSPDGKLLASGGADKFVKVWEIPSGKFLKSFEGHTAHVLDVAWSMDGKRLVSAGADNFVKVWDYEKGEKARDIRNHDKQVSRLAFVPKKPEFVTVAGDGVMRTWNPESGGQGRNYSDAKDFLYSLALSPDGTLIASGGEEGIVRLYTTADGKLVKAIPLGK
ncbi:MAG: c-type cytochrome domain-containing protein [Fimbriiglobus sp.]